MLRVRGRSGRWLTVHASRLHGSSHTSIAVIIEPASPAEVAALIGQGHGLSRRETQVAALTARGLSTAEMAQHLSISANTVQDHLKSIFDKTGARSRRELVSHIFMDEYAPRIGQPPDSSEAPALRAYGLFTTSHRALERNSGPTISTAVPTPIARLLAWLCMPTGHQNVRICRRPGAWGSARMGHEAWSG
jgi:DNA-binding CsgD family transcriptional regulator